jgi:hypothetical protein
VPDEQKIREDLTALAKQALVIHERARVLTEATNDHNERLRALLDEHYSDFLSDYPDFTLPQHDDRVVP